MLKLIFKSKITWFILAFIAGGALASFLLPEKIIVKKDEKIVYKDKIVKEQVVRWREKVVEKVVEKKIAIKKVKNKITYPDGKIVETETYESVSEQLDRMRQLENDKFKTQLAAVTKDYEKKLSYYKEHRNPKRFTIYGGAGTRIDDVTNTHALIGMDTKLWGPVTIGMQTTTHKDVALTLGFRF